MSRLEVRDLRAGYGPVNVLHGVSLTVEPGEIVAVLGANGAGKTTTLKALTGLIPAQGSVTFSGQPITKLSTHTRARLGIAHIPEGRGTLTDLSVLDNLRVGAFARRGAGGIHDVIERWLDFFPRLKERRGQVAGSLSGGEQQMLAVARALMSEPDLLLLDEPSMGLAPRLTAELFEELGRINKETGTAMLMVEQNARRSLQIASRAYVMQTGRFVASGTASEMAHDDTVRRAYLGV